MWSGGPSFAYAWSLTQLVAVPTGPKKAPHVIHRTTPFGTGQSISVPDLRPGSSSLTCIVTATNSVGSTSAPSAPATVLAVAPVLGSSIHIGRLEAWDPADHQQLFKVFAVHGALNPAGTQFVAATATGVAVYPCDLCGNLQQLLAVAKRDTTRTFTQVERRTYLTQG